MSKFIINLLNTGDQSMGYKRSFNMISNNEPIVFGIMYCDKKDPLEKIYPIRYCPEDQRYIIYEETMDEKPYRISEEEFRKNYFREKF